MGWTPLVSENDINSFLGYVHKQKMIYVYAELVETTEDSSDEDGEGDSKNDSEDGKVDANDIIDDEHLVDEVEVNMTAFNFQIKGQEDVPENARSRGLRKLKKAASSSGISNNFYVGKEFANRDLAKERIRAYSIETRRNIDFKRNDKRRIRAVCKGVVPSIIGNNVFVDKDKVPKEDISRKGKEVNEDAKEDKKCCPWVLYLTKGDKAKWVVKTYKDEHQCLQSRKIKHCTSTFLAKHITDLLTMNLEMPIKAIQEHMQKKFHVAVSKTKAFSAKQRHKKWEISDILCKHAIAIIHDMTDNGMDVGSPEDWVHDSYKLKTWMKAYYHKVNPVNGRDIWAKFECPTNLLPQKVNPQIWHNKRGCKENVSSDGRQIATTVPKKNVGRKRSATQPAHVSVSNKEQQSKPSHHGNVAATQTAHVPVSNKEQQSQPSHHGNVAAT
ncbi:hypothetical protein Tco_0516757 [Tanacetum coccineum]